MPGRLEFDLSLSPGARPGIPNRRAVRLLLLGDFSGRDAAQRPPLAARPTHRVDADNLDSLVQTLGTGLRRDGVPMAFGTMDDFHPDSLFVRLPEFAALRGLRQRLADPRQYAAAAAEMRVPAAPVVAAPQPAPAAAPTRDDLLARLLGGAGAAPEPAATAAPAAGLDAFIRQIVAPHVLADVASAQSADLAAVDTATAARMRELLHAPDFQALESAWRGVQWLVSQLELDESLQLHVFDVTREELLDDLVAAGGLVAQTRIFQALVQRGRDQPDAEGWTALVGLWTFDGSVQHIGLLAALGQLAAQAGAPLLAGADLALAGDDVAVLAGWRALRRSAVAPWIGLAAPGVLLRRPYGARSDPVEAFDFEEFAGGVPQPALCLWGCAALAPALLLGRGFSADGWDFRPGADPQIDDLPAVSYRLDGEALLLPVAWPALDEAAAQRLQAAGLMPLWAHRHQPALRLACWQSVAEGGGPLQGRF